MLRINLLPSYVALRRKNKKFIAGWIVGFAAVVTAMLLFEFLYLQPKLNNETQLAEAADQAHTYITNEQALAASTLSAVAPIQAKIDFFNAVQAYNLDYLKLYMTVARFTSPKILYTGMTVSGSTLTINAYTPSIADLGRYLQVMYHEPDISSVSISSIPTPDQAAEKVYTYKGAVIGMTGGSTATSGGVSQGSTGFGANRNGGSTSVSIPGVPPGVTVTLPPGVTLPGQTTTNGPGAQIGNQTGSLPALSPAGFRPGGVGNQQPGGFQNGTSTVDDPYTTILSDPNFDPRYFKITTLKTDGFQFVATCTLKTTFTLPTPPGTPGSTTLTTAGGGGGYRPGGNSAGYTPGGVKPAGT